MSDSPENKHAPSVSAQDLLPPVEPPSAGYIVKLFVIPLVIVAVVVLLVMTFNWLSHSEVDRGRFIQKLQASSPDAWQVAHDLATELQRSKELREDARFAAQLAGVASERLKQPPPDGEGGDAKGEVNFRVYLMRALGQFSVPQPQDVLSAAARQQRNEHELDVRLAAIEGLATLTSNVRAAGRAMHDESLTALLVENSQPGVPPAVRSRAAFGLGICGGDAARAQLRKMLADGYPDVRFNAATGLARYGEDGGELLAVLVEMLDPEQTEGMAVEAEAGSREFKRALIQTNGLRAVELLLQHNTRADLSAVTKAVQRLRDTPNLPAPVQLKAQELLNQLKNR